MEITWGTKSFENIKVLMSSLAIENGLRLFAIFKPPNVRHHFKMAK